MSSSGSVASTGERARRQHVVDPARVLAVPAHDPDRGLLPDRHVDEALGDVARIVPVDHVAFEPVTGVEPRGIGLVRDDADRARLRARAVQRALRTGQRLDPRDVVHVDVEVALDRRDRLLVQVHADAGHRRDGLAVAAGRDAAHVHGREAGAGAVAATGTRRHGHARQHLHVVPEIVDVQLLELLGAERLDADRHVLHVLRALLRGDDDLFELLLRHHGLARKRDRNRDRRAGNATQDEAVLALVRRALLSTEPPGALLDLEPFIAILPDSFLLAFEPTTTIR